MSFFKKRLLVSVALVGVVMPALASAQAIPAAPAEPVALRSAPASGQSAAPETGTEPVVASGAQPGASGQADANGGLGDIVVTAQRRSENLQTVPIAATALNATGLAEKAVTRLADLQYASPSLTVTDAGLTQSVNIRGIGLASGSPAVSNGVATYFNGIFQPPIASTTSFYDIAGVEVLRGPQGTLVGSNSTGGAIFINTQDPKLNDVSGYMQAAYGNYNAANVQGAVNMPITSTLAIRTAANYQRHDSYYHDLGVYDNDPASLDEKSGRVSVLWKPGNFQALYKGELTDRNTGGYAYRPIVTTTYTAGRTSDPFTLDFNAPERNFERVFFNALELRYTLDNGITIRSESGYQNKRVNNLYDTDATAIAGLRGDQFVRERQWSEEINIISPTNGPFNWILGGYYQHNIVNVRITNTGSSAPTRTATDTDKKTEGVFAQGNYKFTDRLELQVGARYSHFDTSATGGLYRGVYTAAGLPNFANQIQYVNGVGSENDGRVTGKVALNYKLDTNNFLYAFAARGYKSGGFNSATSIFAPETVWDYEAGWKSTFANGHLRTQLGGYWNEYNGFQFSIIDTTTGASAVTNLPSARIRGIEAQAQAKFGGFSADAGGAFNDSRLSSFTFVNSRQLPAGTLGPQCPTGVTSNPPICFNYTPYLQTTTGGPNLLSPKWTYNVGAQYTFDFGAGQLTPRANFAYVGPQFTQLFYNPVTDRLAGRGLLSALLTYRLRNYQIEGYATNLLNKVYVSGQTGNNEFYGAPRQYGVRASLTF